MNKILTRLALVSFVVAAPAAHAEFTGDVKLACEALLCLSSGSRPSECSPSIQKYFSITAKKMSDTIKERKSFLNLCPTASQDSSMQALTNAIANGAGRCDAGFLNATLKVDKEVPYCWMDSEGQVCGTKTITVISNDMPSYCTVYTTNAYTYQVNLKYVGNPDNGGHWE